VFGGASDERALAILRECLPGRDIIGIPARDLVLGLGAVHCLTQQQPAWLSPSGPGAEGS
jgi:agmatine deiminase